MGTFLGALVGLVAVYLAHFVAEDYRRHLKGTTVAALLLGELTSYREAYELQRDKRPLLLKAAEVGELPRLPRAKLAGDLALATALPDVGLLGSDICRDVAYVYHNIAASRSALQTILDDQENMSAEAVHATLDAAYQAQDRAKVRGETLINSLSSRVRLRWSIKKAFPSGEVA